MAIDFTIPELDAPPLRRYGMPEYVLGASPAAGAHFVQELGGGFYVRLIALFCRLVTDGNAANRSVLIEYRDDADNRFALSGAAVNQTASTTEDWAFNAVQPIAEWSIDSTVVIPLAPILLPPTFDFRVYVVNIQVGDQLSRIRFLWERFFTGTSPG